jgi:hypothetical protein
MQETTILPSLSRSVSLQKGFPHDRKLLQRKRLLEPQDALMGRRFADLVSYLWQVPVYRASHVRPDASGAWLWMGPECVFEPVVFNGVCREASIAECDDEQWFRGSGAVDAWLLFGGFYERHSVGGTRSR